MVRWKRRMPKNILTDAEVKLAGYLSEKKYPESFRLIRYYDEEDDREFTFLTYATHVSALDIANLYKKRWLVELFFKWLKQHLKIKRFWGTTENAVRIQISVAIITYCLVAIVQHDMQLKRSTYEVLQILSISLTDKPTYVTCSIKLISMMSKNSIVPFLKDYWIKSLSRPFLLDTNDER